MQVARKIVQIAANGERVFVLADDGTLWISTADDAEPWVQARPLPTREAEAWEVEPPAAKG